MHKIKRACCRKFQISIWKAYLIVSSVKPERDLLVKLTELMLTI